MGKKKGRKKEKKEIVPLVFLAVILIAEVMIWELQLSITKYAVSIYDQKFKVNVNKTAIALLDSGLI